MTERLDEFLDWLSRNEAAAHEEGASSDRYQRWALHHWDKAWLVTLSESMMHEQVDR